MWIPKVIYTSVVYITELVDQETDSSKLCATQLTLVQIL